MKGLTMAVALALSAAPVAMMGTATPALAQAGGPQAEAARFTAFIDNEFEQELKQRPQRATALGRKQDNDKWDDVSDAGQLRLLEWRRGSVARMKAQFQREKLPPEARASYDMWAMELDRAETTYKYRRYQPPFYSFLYSIHSELPNFLINTQAVTDAADMRGYNARLKALGGQLDLGIAQSRESSAAGVNAPKFEIERVISGSKAMITGQPFDAAGPDSPLWADAKAKVGKLKAAGKVTDDPANITDLMCHEGIPGHVMQGDIQVRQKGTPKFRSAYRYVAYGEGWALYTEYLCKEMGAYQDVASDFFRLDAELFRAARLVTDTGIHAKGWTEDQAVDYMIKTGRRPPNQARSEVRRYITLPGQATGYKIGMLKIMELRRKAEAALGPKFDVRAYDDLVVGQGSLPLAVLERQVDEWIASQKAN